MNTKKLERIAYIEYEKEKHQYYYDDFNEVCKRDDGKCNPDWDIDTLSEDLLHIKVKKIKKINADIIASILEYFENEELNEIQQHNANKLKILLRYSKVFNLKEEK